MAKYFLAHTLAHVCDVVQNDVERQICIVTLAKKVTHYLHNHFRAMHITYTLIFDMVLNKYRYIEHGIHVDSTL